MFYPSVKPLFYTFPTKLSFYSLQQMRLVENLKSACYNIHFHVSENFDVSNLIIRFMKILILDDHLYACFM